MPANSTGSCDCGQASFEIHGPPLMRMICHCETCQKYVGAAYNDSVFYFAKDVTEPPADRIDYAGYQKPALVQRGKCTSCGKPAIEYADLPGLPKIIGVPTSNLPEPAAAPDPRMHIFYHRRQADANDDLPKHSGFLSSQLAFTREFIKSLLWARKAA